MVVLLVLVVLVLRGYTTNPCYSSSTEAEVMKSNSWLYHYYMVQSRLQYGLAYGAHTPGLAAYYPQMLGGGAQPQPFYDTSPHSLSQAYLGKSLKVISRKWHRF